MVDTTRGKIKVPARFVPYLEKHRIYELFHELTREMIIKQPQDHVLFLKETIHALNVSRNYPKIIILAAPRTEKEKLGDYLAGFTGTHVVTVTDVIRSDSQDHLLRSVDPSAFARCATKLLRSEPYLSTGWILLDFPRTLQEAVALQRNGIQPTHVLQFTGLQCKPGGEPAEEQWSGYMGRYKEILPELARAYRQTLRKLNVEGKSVEDVAKEATQIVQVWNHAGAPMSPRVLILGLPGSGKRTQAILIAKRFNLVNIELARVVERARVGDNDLGDKIRAVDTAGDRLIKLGPNIVRPLIKERLREKECLDQGWVMTGYPENAHDFYALDSLETPPNRVVLLNVPKHVCYKRMARSGFHDIPRNSRMDSDMDLTKHPESCAHSKLAEYERLLQEMALYCGKTGTRVDGSGSVRAVFERVSAVVMRPAPPAGLRDFWTVFPNTPQNYNANTPTGYVQKC